MEDKKIKYQHGGDIYTEGLLKGRTLLDFSSNINPLGIPNSFKAHIEEALISCERYPDVYYRELIDNLKAYISKDYETRGLNFIVGNGASEIIDLAISLFKKILIIAPSFYEYEKSAGKWGAEIVNSYLDEDMQYDYEDIEKKLLEVEAVIIGNPNNPCGNVIDKHKFIEIVKLCEKADKTIIVDEAFIEFVGDKTQSVVIEAHKYKCLFVIRALTKYFALPGIRFGYGITSNEALKLRLEKLQNPWSVNCFAEIAAKYVLRDYSYIEASEDLIRKERSFMLEELRKTELIERVYNTNSNFVLCKLRGITGEQLYKKCIDRGIVIRKVGNFKGLDESFVRFAIKNRIHNEKLLEVLRA